MIIISKWCGAAALIAIVLSLNGCYSGTPAAPSGGEMASLEGKLVDLTHPFDANTIYWPTEQGFRFEQGNNGVTDKGYYYSANRFCTAEHGGTHIDAPIHFFAGRQTVDQIPLERLIG